MSPSHGEQPPDGGKDAECKNQTETIAKGDNDDDNDGVGRKTATARVNSHEGETSARFWWLCLTGYPISMPKGRRSKSRKNPSAV